MKNIKLILIICIIVVIAVLGFVLLKPENNNLKTGSLLNPLTNQIKTTEPSKTLKEYQDPAGFSFEYSDNLSITNNEIEDNSTYASLQLTSNDVSGNLSLTIVDSKYKTIEDWLKANKEATIGNPKEVKLGNLKAYEIKTNDRLLTAAIDQGILFTIEMPLVEEGFWTKVYNQISTSFSFGLPENTTSSTNTGYSNSDITFEGEEVVE